MTLLFLRTLPAWLFNVLSLRPNPSNGVWEIGRCLAKMQFTKEIDACDSICDWDHPASVHLINFGRPGRAGRARRQAPSSAGAGMAAPARTPGLEAGLPNEIPFTAMNANNETSFHRHE
jgi:hypothetical protein